MPPAALLAVAWTLAARLNESTIAVIKAPKATISHWLEDRENWTVVGSISAPLPANPSSSVIKLTATSAVVIAGNIKIPRKMGRLVK